MMQHVPSGQHLWVKEYLREVLNFPKPGIRFQSISPLLASPEAMERVVKIFAARYKDQRIDRIVAVASRGFLLGSFLAQALRVPLVLAAKKGKLPPEIVQCEYELEYGRDCLEIETRSLQPGQRVLLVDDVIATGGTLRAAASLVERLGAEVAEIAVFTDLADLPWKQALENYSVYSLLSIGEGA